MKANEWWALKYPWKDSGGFLPHFMASTKKSLIKKIEDAYEKPWATLRKGQGFKLVKVTIHEVPPQDNKG